MNIQKAIEIKEIYYKGGVTPNYSDYQKADRLSIEALKRIQEYRESITPRCRWMLPGETRD